MSNDNSQTWQRFIVNGELAPGIMRVLAPLGKRQADLDRAIRTLMSDAIIYGYKAGTSHNSWTKTGKEGAARKIEKLMDLQKLLAKHNWKERPRIVGKDADEFYWFAKSFFWHGNRERVAREYDDLFEISTHYKYVNQDRPPCSYSVIYLYYIHEKLTSLLWQFERVLEAEEKAKKKWEAVKEDLKKLERKVHLLN